MKKLAKFTINGMSHWKAGIGPHGNSFNDSSNASVRATGYFQEGTDTVDNGRGVGGKPRELESLNSVIGSMPLSSFNCSRHSITKNGRKK